MKNYILTLPCDSEGYVWNIQELDEKCTKLTLTNALKNMHKNEVLEQIVKNNADIIIQLIE